jgi:spore germination cell wall hydrolase CwlJ-like protein
MISTVSISLWATHRPAVIAEIYKVDLSDSIQKLSPVIQTAHKVKLSSADYQCLLKNVYYEAGVENRVGKIAVAQVTLNRVRSANYPDTICDVVMQPSQFSWANNRDRRWTHPTGPKWETSKRIARQVIKEGYRVPALQAAVFYHADYVSPAWKDSNAVIAQVGTHIFYTSAR